MQNTLPKNLARYILYADDNYHYQDEDERYTVGRYETAEEAIEIAKLKLDAFLTSRHQPDMSAQELYRIYTTFGEDYFIKDSEGRENVEFSAWGWAKERCGELCP